MDQCCQVYQRWSQQHKFSSEKYKVDQRENLGACTTQSKNRKYNGLTKEKCLVYETARTLVHLNHNVKWNGEDCHCEEMDELVRGQIILAMIFRSTNIFQFGMGYYLKTLSQRMTKSEVSFQMFILSAKVKEWKPIEDDFKYSRWKNGDALDQDWVNRDEKVDRSKTYWGTIKCERQVCPWCYAKKSLYSSIMQFLNKTLIYLFTHLVYKYLLIIHQMLDTFLHQQ